LKSKFLNKAHLPAAKLNIESAGFTGDPAPDPVSEGKARGRKEETGRV